MWPRSAISIILIVLFSLVLVRLFNLSIPLTVTTTTRSSELAVTGEAKVDVVPDVAHLNAGISVRGAANAQEARQRIDQINNRIITALTNLRIDKKDIKTTNYSIHPNVVFRDSQDVESGYNANANVEIKVRNNGMVSQVIDEVSKAGATDISGPNFAIDDPAKFREEARNKAIENAKEQAQKLAKSLGIRLGKITNIVESSQNGPMPFARGAALDSSAPDIEPGSQTVSSVVTLYFEKR